MHNYDLTVRDEYSVVIARLNGKLHTATSEHPNWDAIKDGLDSDLSEQEVVDLFDMTEAANAKFEEVTDRVSIRNGKVYLDGDEVDNSLAQQVMRYYNEGLNFRSLVNFYEKVLANPNEHSREQLFTWLRDRDFSITDEGDIIAYKSVYDRGDGVYGSVATSGSAIVNGEPRTGSIRQSVGDVVTMPRSAVEHDPGVGCHTGLHAGTWSYASTFSGNTILVVAVNPRDVVSVPTDCDAQKLRTCRYEILDVTTSPLTSPEYATRDEDDDLGFDGEDVEHWYEEDDELPEEVGFFVGDYVRVKPGETAGRLAADAIYQVVDQDEQFVYLDGVGGGYLHRRFEKVDAPTKSGERATPENTQVGDVLLWNPLGGSPSTRTRYEVTQLRSGDRVAVKDADNQVGYGGDYRLDSFTHE